MQSAGTPFVQKRQFFFCSSSHRKRAHDRRCHRMCLDSKQAACFQFPAIALCSRDIRFRAVFFRLRLSEPHAWRQPCECAGKSRPVLPPRLPIEYSSETAGNAGGEVTFSQRKTAFAASAHTGTCPKRIAVFSADPEQSSCTTLPAQSEVGNASPILRSQRSSGPQRVGRRSDFGPSECEDRTFRTFQTHLQARE